MEFNPNNNIVKLCLRGMVMEEQGKSNEAGSIFEQARNEATDDFEKFLACYYLARHQKDIALKLKWLETALQFALNTNDNAVKSALPYLYTHIAKCQEDLGYIDESKKNYELANSFSSNPMDKGPFYHGTKAALQIGDLLTAGGTSNYSAGLVMNHIYFTGLANGAGLAASLAKGDGRERVYIVEPIGAFENDPNVTDKKFPGNLTRSYRSPEPLKIVGELTDWAKQTAGDVESWRKKLKNSDGEIIN